MFLRVFYVFLYIQVSIFYLVFLNLYKVTICFKILNQITRITLHIYRLPFLNRSLRLYQHIHLTSFLYWKWLFFLNSSPAFNLVILFLLELEILMLLFQSKLHLGNHIINLTNFSMHVLRQLVYALH